MQKEDQVTYKDLLEIIGGLYVERSIILQKLKKLEEQIIALTSSKNEG